MGAIIGGFLWALVLLFTLRLYQTNRRFAEFITWLFSRLELLHDSLKHHLPYGLVGYFIVLVFISVVLAFLAAISGLNFFNVCGTIVLILIPAFPLFLEWADRSQRTEALKFIDTIRTGRLREADLDEIKQAIKDYYAKKYAPSTPYDPNLDVVAKTTLALWLLITPRTWPRLIIPRLTAIPLFSALFYDSPYHYRFHQYHVIYDSVYIKSRAHPYRLRTCELEIDDEFMIIDFIGIEKNIKNRALGLAKVIEQEFGLAKDAIYVQENVDQVKFFIPKAS